MHEIAYTYDGTLEGLLTAIFASYERHEEPTDVVTTENVQLRLGQELHEVETDLDRAVRVHSGIMRSCGSEVFDAVKHASLSDDPQAGTIVYRYVRLAMHGKLTQRALVNDFTHNEVFQLQQLNRSVSRERHFIMQFLRFEHLDNGVWFAKCNPKASVVPLVMDWFSARFNTQAFIIYDEVHDIAGVYEGSDWYLVKSDSLTLPDHAPDEKLMQTAWKRFYDTIGVEARYNPELRRQFMPKRFWKNITEVKDIMTDALACG